MITFGDDKEVLDKAKYLQKIQEEQFDIYKLEFELKELLKKTPKYTPEYSRINKKIEELKEKRWSKGIYYLDECYGKDKYIK